MPETHFRQDIVRTLPYIGAKNSQCIYWDETLPCFGLRVYPNGRRSYVCSYRIKGRKRLKTLGRADVLTLDIARKKARAALGHVIEGRDPKETQDILRASPTVKTLCAEYIERHAKPKKRSWKNDKSYLDLRVITKLGTHLAASITSEDISRLHSEIGADAPYSANRVLEIIRKMFNLARIWGLVPQNMRNPATGIERFAEVKRKRFVTTSEMPNLARAIEQEPNLFARHALWLLLLTGVRRNELLRAKWSDIDQKQRTLSIGQTKNGDPILAPLSRAAMARLKQIPRIKGNPYIICGAEKDKHLVNLSKPWARIREAAGMPDVRIHDLRRTVGSWLVRNGASLHLVGAVLNHRDQKTTAGYAYFQTQDRMMALDKHGLHITRLAKPRLRSSRENRPQQLSFKREQLYKMVWSQPISQLARQHGVSDVGLAKACKRAAIPIPPRGHWAKCKVGKSVQIAPLPQNKKQNDLITISWRRPQSVAA